MIKSIIFDFGDVFINLDKKATANLLNTELLKNRDVDIEEINKTYEVGKLTTEAFLNFYSDIFTETTRADLKNAWNAILQDFPTYRLEFIKKLKTEYDFKLILLSNTNALHIEWIKNKVPFYEEFKSCFDAFYLSHEIHLRKPDTEIFDFVLQENSLEPQETLFIDDTKANTDTAKALGIHVWNNNPEKEDVIDLFRHKKELF
ncbi:HAD-IA family hydrolase [Aquimarina brevivitae]|uniref:Putative hydrolase of the HAD superfamily n=1 Tax=Aquimarina brevivitae TaxID=323412 RepID=A0A4Q7NYT2_9FLAO|nr:HAD-IA family hydrolase [Aquimarina brevivitae]RZS92621.1 putative hydrolase of the HAD superfamily [Aquimarina brevivitae]